MAELSAEVASQEYLEDDEPDNLNGRYADNGQTFSKGSEVLSSLSEDQECIDLYMNIA
jgi:hypothetical protein